MVSCGSDDDKGGGQSPIVGTWKPVSEVYENTDTGQTTNELSVCEAEYERITFNSNGSVIGELYSGNDVNNCTFDGSPQGVTWSISGNQLTYHYPSIGSDTYTITFSNNNNTRVEVIHDGPYIITTIYARVN